MIMQKITAESFQRDVEKFQITITNDLYVYRHMHVGDPATMNMSYQLTTFPGHLVFSGDMGTYVFRRTNDMFTFFRGKHIYLSYWAQKIVAADKCCGYKEFSPAKAIQPA